MYVAGYFPIPSMYGIFTVPTLGCFLMGKSGRCR